MKKATQSTKISEIVRVWHLVDMKGQVLGRGATKIALLLSGKSKPKFVRNLDCGDYVVVTNARELVVTGKKESEKLYGNYSGFPGGLKQKPLWKLRAEKPGELIRRAVMGMLPKNKLRDRLITRLYVYADEKHPYGEKIKILNPKS